MIPAGFRTDKPPETGEQIVAWAYDEYGLDRDTEDYAPRWVIAQWAAL